MSERDDSANGFHLRSFPKMRQAEQVETTSDYFYPWSGCIQGFTIPWMIRIIQSFGMPFTSSHVYTYNLFFCNRLFRIVYPTCSIYGTFSNIYHINDLNQRKPGANRPTRDSHTLAWISKCVPFCTVRLEPYSRQATMLNPWPAGWKGGKTIPTYVQLQPF